MLYRNDREYIDKCYKIIKFLANNIMNLNKYAGNLVYFACDYGYLDLIELLIEKGVNIYEYKNGFSSTILEKHFDIARIFVANRPSICSEFVGLLKYEIYYNHVETIKFFIDNGIDINLFDDPEVKKIIELHKDLEDKIFNFISIKKTSLAHVS